MAGGCHLLKPRPAGDLRSYTDPDERGEYFLYTPPGFHTGRAWPLLVLCHGSTWSSPRSIIADWDQLADEHQFVLVAPELHSTSDLPPSGEKLRAAQERDEAAILAAVQQARAAVPVAADKIFIAGHKAGCRAALFTGLRHPEVFRAVALLLPRFDPEHAHDVVPFIDPHQPVLVVRGMGDLAKTQSDAAADWMRGHTMNPSEVRTAQPPGRQAEMAYEFFNRAARLYPRIRIEAFQEGASRRIQFHARTSLTDVFSYHWDFGDGSEPAVVSDPDHEYAAPGEYQVTLTVQPERNSKQTHQRRIRIVLPPG